MLTRAVLWAVPIVCSVIASASADTIGPGGIWCYKTGQNEDVCENVGGQDGGIDPGGGPLGLQAAVIQVKTATYGGNCGAPRGNDTLNLAAACNGRITCDYKVDSTVIGDPAPGCEKEYSAQNFCNFGDVFGDHPPRPQLWFSTLKAEAGFGSVLHLDCRSTINVESATYGRNCGAPQGNQTANLAAACDGRESCDYKVDFTVIGDPAPGCKKDYTVQNQCRNEHGVRVSKLNGEAGFGSVVHLDCQ